MKFNYVIGDATQPILKHGERAIITHCCNNIGVWGAGFVLALSKVGNFPELCYKKWFKEKIGPEGNEFKLGEVILVPFTIEECTTISLKDQWILVANIIGQDGIKFENGNPPIRYDAITSGFNGIKKQLSKMRDIKFNIHTPRIGCGLAGGKWDEIAKCFIQVFGDTNIEVIVYDLDEESAKKFGTPSVEDLISEENLNCC